MWMEVENKPDRRFTSTRVGKEQRARMRDREDRDRGMEGLKD